MAVHVEDHPLEYFDFEGVIPAGEYGGGDVIVWDWGTWAPADGDDPVAAVEAGNLHFDLDGEKLKGRFVLVRRGRGDGKEQWLLLHKHDDVAVDGLGSRGPPAVGEDRPHQRRGQGRARRQLVEQFALGRTDARRARRPRRPRQVRRSGSSGNTR